MSLTIDEHNMFLPQKIQINVAEPIKKTVTGGISIHVLYKIHGIDKNGEFCIYRRYNDFWCIREAMLRNWPGCFIPPIPKKKTLVKENEN